nr:hypothetical protein [Marinococcus halophilus]
MFIGYLLILKQDAVNRPALVSNVFMALAIMTILSVGMNQANEFTDQAVDAVNFENGTNTLADDAIKNNITDVALYDLQGWESTELEEENQINPSYAQDLTINAPLNEDTQINSDETLNDRGQDIVSKKIQTLPDGTRQVTDLEDGGWISNITQEYYYRYNVDWVPLIATLTVVAAVLVIIGVKLATLFFNLAFNYVLAPLVAASDMHSGQRMKQVVQNIISIFMVTIMVFLSLKIYMIAADMLNDSTDGLVYVLGMVGLSVAVLDGPNIVERLFGLDAGLKSSWGALAGTYAAAKGAAGVTKAGMSGVRNISDNMSNNKEPSTGGSGGSGGSGNPNTGNSQDREDVSQAAEGQAGQKGTGNVANMADYRGNKSGTDSQNNDTANESVTDQGDTSTANGSASSTNGASAASSADQTDNPTSDQEANDQPSSIPSLHEEMDDEQAKATGTDGPTKGQTNRQGTNANATSPANGQRPSSTSETTASPDTDDTPATGDTPASVDANTDTGDTASVQHMNGESTGSAGTHREQVTQETDSSSTQNVEQDMQTVQGQQSASGGNVQTNQSGAAGASASTETSSTGNAPASASANTDTGDTASVQHMNGETTGSAGTHRESVTQEMDGTSTQNVEQDVQTVQGQQSASGGNVQTNQSGSASNAGSPETPSTGNAPASASANGSGQDTASVQHMNGETTGSAGTHREQVTQEVDGQQTQNVEQDVQTVQGQQSASGGNVQTNQSGAASNAGSPETPSTGNAPASANANSSSQDTASVQNVKGDSAGTSGTHREQVTQEVDGQQTQNVEQEVQTATNHRQDGGQVNTTSTSGGETGANEDPSPASSAGPGPSAPASSPRDAGGNSVRQERSTEQGSRGGTSKETIHQEQQVNHQGNDTEQDVQQSVTHRQTEGRVNRRERVTEHQEPMKRNYDLGKTTRKTVKRNNKKN